MLTLFFTMLARGDEKDLAEKLDSLNAQIKQSPDEPMPYYRKAQCLMKMDRREEGFQTAKQAMGVFVKAGNDLSWMMLESVDAGNVKVDVHFNMGRKERTPPED